MAFRCANCGKGTVMGVTQRHRRGVAGKRWNKRAQATPRTFKPNLQSATIMLNGVEEQVKLCTRCLKKFKRENAIVGQNVASL